MLLRKEACYLYFKKKKEKKNPYANIQGVAHINNSKLKHKAYEDTDTMSSIQPKKKMLCQVAELEQATSLRIYTIYILFFYSITHSIGPFHTHHKNQTKTECIGLVIISKMQDLVTIGC